VDTDGADVCALTKHKCPKVRVTPQVKATVLADETGGGSKAWSGWSSSKTITGDEAAHGLFEKKQSASKEWSGLKAHKIVTVQLRYWAIDSWDGSWGRVYVDKKQVWAKMRKVNAKDGWSNYNGKFPNPWGGDKPEHKSYIDVAVSVAHSSSKLTLKIDSTLDQALSDESWAFNRLKMRLCVSKDDCPIADVKLSYHERACAKTCGICSSMLPVCTKRGVITTTIPLKQATTVDGSLRPGEAASAAKLRASIGTDVAWKHLFYGGKFSSPAGKFVWNAARFNEAQLLKLSVALRDSASKKLVSSSALASQALTSMPHTGSSVWGGVGSARPYAAFVTVSPNSAEVSVHSTSDPFAVASSLTGGLFALPSVEATSAPEVFIRGAEASTSKSLSLSLSSLPDHSYVSVRMRVYMSMSSWANDRELKLKLSGAGSQRWSTSLTPNIELYWGQSGAAVKDEGAQGWSACPLDAEGERPFGSNVCFSKIACVTFQHRTSSLPLKLEAVIDRCDREDRCDTDDYEYERLFFGISDAQVATSAKKGDCGAGSYSWFAAAKGDGHATVHTDADGGAKAWEAWENDHDRGKVKTSKPLSWGLDQPIGLIASLPYWLNNLYIALGLFFVVAPFINKQWKWKACREQGPSLDEDPLHTSVAGRRFVLRGNAAGCSCLPGRCGGISLNQPNVPRALAERGVTQELWARQLQKQAAIQKKYGKAFDCVRFLTVPGFMLPCWMVPWPCGCLWIWMHWIWYLVYLFTCMVMPWSHADPFQVAMKAWVRDFNEELEPHGVFLKPFTFKKTSQDAGNAGDENMSLATLVFALTPDEAQWLRMRNNLHQGHHQDPNGGCWCATCHQGRTI